MFEQAMHFLWEMFHLGTMSPFMVIVSLTVVRCGLDHIRPFCLFISPSTRKAVNDGRADYLPIFLNETGRLYDDKQIPVDVALMNLSPPDSHGYCSLGVSIDSTYTVSVSTNEVV